MNIQNDFSKISILYMKCNVKNINTWNATYMLYEGVKEVRTNQNQHYENKNKLAQQ